MKLPPNATPLGSPTVIAESLIFVMSSLSIQISPPLSKPDIVMLSMSTLPPVVGIFTGDTISAGQHTNGVSVGVSVGVTNDLTEKFDAVELVKIAASVLGGKGGGGRIDFAQAGGVDQAKVEDAFKAVLK